MWERREGRREGEEGREREGGRGKEGRERERREREGRGALLSSSFLSLFFTIFFHHSI